MRALRWILVGLVLPAAAYAAVEVTGGGVEECPPTPDCPCAASSRS